MKLDGKGRDYGQVQTLIEKLGGRMEWHRGGPGGGGYWELTLGEYTRLVRLRSVAEDPHNVLDKMYVTSHPNPQHISDYPPDAETELVEDAPERLVRFLVRGEE